jgi:type I restriction enzyme S subunit
MIKVEVQEITNNLDRIRVPLNSKQRAEKETNPIYPYIGANNIMGYIDEYLFDEKILCVAEDGGSWGYQQTCAKIYNEKVWVNNHAHVLTAKDNLILEYLMYYMNYADLSLYINGATRGKLTKSSLNNIKIPLPPLDQQKKIASVLDAADAYRQKTKALIEKYDALTQSLFLDMFGDPRLNEKRFEQNNLNEFLEFITYGLTVRPEYIENGIRLISAREIRSGKLDLTSGPQISERDYKKLSTKGKPKKGEILFSKTGSIGHSAIIETDIKFAITQNAARLVFKESVNPIFALGQLRSSYFQSLCQQRAKGNAVKDLQLGDMKKLPFMLPPLKLQNQFADSVKAIEAQKAQAQASLAQAEDLFKSLLQRAFKGELTANTSPVIDTL